jgi:hypothetical protein
LRVAVGLRLHDADPSSAWWNGLIITVMADGERIAPDGYLAVHRTDDAGETRTRLDKDLPHG